MGLTKNHISSIVLMQSFIISSIASIVAIILSALILYIEKTYHFIKIPNDIYFMDYLAIEISFFSFIIYPLSAILINSLFIFQYTIYYNVFYYTKKIYLVTDFTSFWLCMCVCVFICVHVHLAGLLPLRV